MQYLLGLEPLQSLMSDWLLKCLSPTPHLGFPQLRSFTHTHTCFSSYFFSQEVKCITVPQGHVSGGYGLEIRRPCQEIWV